MTLRALADAVRELDPRDFDTIQDALFAAARLIEQAAAPDGLAEWVRRYFERLDHIRATNDPDEQAQYGAGVELAEREIRSRLAATPSHPATSETVE